MKKFWQKISVRIDSRTLRERAMLFTATAGLVIFLVFYAVLNPSYAKQKLLLEEMGRQRDRIAAVEADITRTIEAHTLDPDLAERKRLNKIQAEAQALKNALDAMQQGMVPAGQMTGLLDQILRTHRGLRLTSMRTLPDSAPGVAASQLLHRHGVELVVQGSYPDMIAYMSALEGMQGQLFWSHAAMAVNTWPTATLTLTVYTVNLDKKWLKL